MKVGWEHHLIAIGIEPPERRIDPGPQADFRPINAQDDFEPIDAVAHLSQLAGSAALWRDVLPSRDKRVVMPTTFSQGWPGGRS
jgi:hypothetical protein